MREKCHEIAHGKGGKETWRVNDETKITTGRLRTRPIGSRAKMNIDNAVIAIEKARKALRSLTRPSTPAEYQNALIEAIDQLGEAEIQLLQVPASAQIDQGDCSDGRTQPIKR